MYLALNRGCFETVLMKNIPRTLGVKYSYLDFLGIFWEKYFSNYVTNNIVWSNKYKEILGVNKVAHTVPSGELRLVFAK
jgi:hypothetical protein